MKKYILTLLAFAAVAVAGAQTPVKTVVLTDKEGNNTYYNASDVQGIAFTPAPEYDTLDQLLLTRYEEKNELGLYHVELGMGAPDAEGQPANIGDVQVALMIAGPWSDNLREPKLPAGYYRVGNGQALWTFDITQSTVWIRVAEGPEGVTPLMIVDGTVDVRNDNGVYDIRMELLTMDGMTRDFRYQGKIDFPGGYGDFEPFTENVDITFTTGTGGRFYGNWYYPFAADLSAEFYQGNVVNGTFMDGYYLNIDFYEPKPADPMASDQVIADGVYTVESRESVAFNSYLPFTYNAGKKLDFMGQELITKTYLQYISPDGKRKLGLIKSGTFTVSENGTKFVFDFVTEEGISIKGTYNGKPTLMNVCDNDVREPKRPYSTIKADHTFTWAEGTQASVFNMGHCILDNLNTYSFYICRPAMDKGQYLNLFVNTESDELTDGTYTLNWTLANNNIIPGTVDFGGQLMFSWYGDLDKVDSEGYNTDLACLATGTMTISSIAGSSDRKIVLNLVDDAGNKLTGEFVGQITDITENPAQVNHFKKITEQNMRKFSKSLRAR